ncbi:MAG TPA: hypothetical protein VD993_07595 [Chitinophagaceae bacterium]|nr:hypothetical protein [Chitinophagaceae bacterium]
MARKKILIITHTNDNTSVEKVIQFINEAGGEAIRFNVDRYPLDYRLSSVFDGNRWQILLENEEEKHNLEDLSACWYRRSFNLGTGLKEIMSKEYLGPAMLEIKRTLFGMLESLPCFHIERYSVYRRLDSKEEQLKIAGNHGLKIPATCISNSPEQAKQFIDAHEQVVTKMQSSFAIYRGEQEHVVFTNAITADHLHDLDGLALCPMTFQEKLEKKLELRVTIVGKKIFCFSIDSQKVANAQVDWRKEGASMIDEWQPYQLPKNIAAKLLALMEEYKLNYGAIDLILTPDDEYYFLEVNAAGEYFWLDKLCNHEISKHIAGVLMGTEERN